MIVDPNTILHDSVSARISGRDEVKAKFFQGQKVKLLEDIKNDGTYPHLPVGALMIRKGAIGYIKGMGDFLQVIRVYEVHFLDATAVVEVIGCREHELEEQEPYRDLEAEEQAWMSNYYQTKS